MRDALSVELVYDLDCPNVKCAREAIAMALREADAPSGWTEWDREGRDTPAALRGFGSPTVLVNGRDVSATDADDTRADANCCRVYRDAGGRMSGAPAVDQIVRAVRRARGA